MNKQQVSDLLLLIPRYSIGLDDDHKSTWIDTEIEHDGEWVKFADLERLITRLIKGEVETIHDTLVKFQISPKTLAERDFAQVGQNCNPYRADSSEWKVYEQAYDEAEMAYDKDIMFEPCYE